MCFSSLPSCDKPDNFARILKRLAGTQVETWLEMLTFNYEKARTLPHHCFIWVHKWKPLLMMNMCVSCPQSLFIPLQKYVAQLSTVRDCVETCVEKGRKRQTALWRFLIFLPIKFRYSGDAIRSWELEKSNFTHETKHDCHAK